MKVAITGASSGIGAATAEVFRARGWDVTALGIAMCDVPGVQNVPLDLSEDASIQAAIAALEPGFNVLVNNAGIPPTDGAGAKILSVNFFGTRAFSDRFEDLMNPGGAIVNVASLAGSGWQQNMPEVKALLATSTRDDVEQLADQSGLSEAELYNLSKEAVIAWTQFDAERLLAKNLRANSVSPAATSTAILEDFQRAFGVQSAANIRRIGRPGTAKECAAVIAFLASPDSAWVKGVDIKVDGGLHAMRTMDMLA